MWRKISQAEPCKYDIVKCEEFIRQEYPWYKITISKCSDCGDCKVEVHMKDIGIDRIIEAHGYETIMEALVKFSQLRQECLDGRRHNCTLPEGGSLY
jgi:hypothetical protein